MPDRDRVALRRGAPQNGIRGFFAPVRKENPGCMEGEGVGEDRGASPVIFRYVLD